MKPFSILLFLVTLATYSFAQIDQIHKVHEHGADAEPPYKIPSVGAFLDSLLVRDSVKQFNLSSSNGFADICEDTPKIFHDTAFNKHDIMFLRKQIVDNRNREWMASDSVMGARIISKGEILSFSVRATTGWDKFHKKYGKGFYVYSIPIFSVDGAKAILMKSFHTDDNDNYGSISLYRCIKGKWKVTKTYSKWKE